MKVLLAVGEKNLSKLLRSHMTDAGFEVAKDDVHHRYFLDEVIEVQRPDLVILHDRLLASDQPDSKSNQEEFLEMIERWRRNYDTSLRVCVMCERDRKDPFLAQLVSRNVLDIFNERQIRSVKLVEQLMEPPKYVNVAKYGITESEIDSLMDEGVPGEESLPVNEEETPPKLKNLKLKNLKFKMWPKKSGPKNSKLPKSPIKLHPSLNIELHRHSYGEEKERALQERRIILVISPFDRTGSTFISHQLAYKISKDGNKVSYFENPFKYPYTFDRVAGHTREPHYFSLYNKIPEDDGNEYVRVFSAEGVGINALNPEYEQSLKEEQFPISRFLRLLLSVHDAAYLIVDVGADTSKEVYDELIEIASNVLVVLDNDIPRLEMFEQYQTLDRFAWIHNALSLKKTIVVGNHYVEGIEDSMPSDNFIEVPSFSDKSVFLAQSKGTFGFHDRDSIKKHDEVFGKLAKEIIDEKRPRKPTIEIRKIKNWIPKISFSKDQTNQEGLE